MNATELDTKAAPFAWIAARDAAMKSYAASTLYTDAQKVRAERMKLGLEQVEEEAHAEGKLAVWEDEAQAQMARQDSAMRKKAIDTDYQR